MKQSAAKTLGAAALGAAFAAAAAGSASAAPAVPAVPDTASALSSATTTLPVQNVATRLPAGAPAALAGGQNAITGSATTLPMTVADAVAKPQPVGGKGGAARSAVSDAMAKAQPAGGKGVVRSADPLKGLLGGLKPGALPGIGS